MTGLPRLIASAGPSPNPSDRCKETKQSETARSASIFGRVISEALPNGITPKAVAGTFVSKPAANGLKTVVKYQRVLAQRYFDAAGFPGRTVGLDLEGGKQKTAGN